MTYIYKHHYSQSRMSSLSYWAMRSSLYPRNIPYWQIIRGHLSRNETRINKDMISKNIWSVWCEAGSCVQSQNAGSEPVSRMERITFFKFGIWQEYFFLITLNYGRNLAKLVPACVLIFCDNLTNCFYPLFEAFCCPLLTVEFPTHVNIYLLMGELW